MGNVLNKITGEYYKKVHTPKYTWTTDKDGNRVNYTLRADGSKKYILGAVENPDDWIINPTQEEIDQYKKDPQPADPDYAEREQMIEDKKREMAILELQSEGKLNENGDLIK